MSRGDSSTLNGAVRSQVRDLVEPGCREGRVVRVVDESTLIVAVRSLMGDTKNVPAVGWQPRATDDGPVDPVRGDKAWLTADEDDQFVVTTWIDAAANGLVTDGTTDNIMALRARIAALGVAGTISLPPGEIGFTGLLVIPSHVNVRGAGSDATILKALTPDSSIQFGDAAGEELVSYFGLSSGWTFDGNLESTDGVVFGAINGTFIDIMVKKVNGDGGTVIGQNCTFISCTWGDNHGAGTVLDNGTGGNVFHNHRSSYNTGYNVDIRETADPSPGAYLIPEMNFFYGALIEMCGSPSFGEAAAGAGNLRQLAGAHARFVDTNFYSNRDDVAVVKLQPNTVSGRSGDVNGRLYLRDCVLTGSGGTSIGIWADAVSGGAAGPFPADVVVILEGDTIFAGLDKAIKWGTTSPIFDEGTIDYYGVTTPGITPDGTGALAWFRQAMPPLVVPAKDSPWADVGGGAEPVNYYKQDGKVFVGGSCVGGAVGSTIFTLDEGFRPDGIRYFPQMAYNGSAWVSALVQVNGSVAGADAGKVILVTGGYVVTLDGIEFRQES